LATSNKTVARSSANNPVSAQDLQNVAEKWDHADLEKIWDSIKKGDKPRKPWREGKQFEYLVIRAFQIEGATVRWPYSVTLREKIGVVEQFDGGIYIDNQLFLVESKNLSEAAAIEAVAKLRFRLERRPPTAMGIIFSVSDFSLPTEVFAQFASPMNVLLWGRSDMDAALREKKMFAGLKEKFLQACERGIPLFALDYGVSPTSPGLLQASTSTASQFSV